jgi:CRISPR system Cascade subunit CasE
MTDATTRVLTDVWFESRASLRPERARALLSLAPELFRGGPAASHRLVWNLFGDGDERRRDFLFRTVADRPLTAVIRSARKPQDPFDLWRIETRPFAPSLAVGQKLRFRVRAVPSVQRKRAPGERSQRRSVVMDLPAGDPEARRAQAAAAALVWLGQRAEANGFALLETDVTDVRRVRVARGGGESILLGAAEFEGRLAVVAPDRFLALLHSGVGPNRAFGYGLIEVAPDRAGQELAV